MDEALQDKIERGLVVLGGCDISPDDPDWQCNDCGVQLFRQE